MNTKVFRQYDSRWGGLAYPTRYSTVSSDGCGLCSVTHCAIEVGKYANFTPRDIQPFMIQYAVAGNGTRWDGIDAGLNKYIGNCKRHSDMASFWNEVSKGNRVGVVLFRSGYGPDGTLWTTGGHYIAFTAYKHENGKDWLYMKDSGARCHDGWYSYQDSMAGRIQFLWTAELPKNGWLKESGYWYFYKNGSKVKNNWAQDTKKKWYWLGSDGKMAVLKWVKWNSKWYYMTSDGSMATGWIRWKGAWYWLKSDGAMAANEWLQYKNDWYWLKADGSMATGTVVINGKTHIFDNSGKWIREA